MSRGLDHSTAYARIRRRAATSARAKAVHAQLFTLRYLRELIRPRPTYAQAGEDLAVERLLGSVRSFVDIGAHDGITYSNTFLFALRGARGVCFEPIPTNFARLRALHRLTRRVECRNYGISDASRAGSMVAAHGLSYLPETLDEEHLRAHPELTPGSAPERVELRTFADSMHGLGLPNPVDLLSVDVEGHELPVLRSVADTGVLFRAVIVETHLDDQSTDERLWTHHDLGAIEDLLAALGYEPAETTFVNTVYVQRALSTV
jgi:FkbM family methyltransferase